MVNVGVVPTFVENPMPRRHTDLLVRLQQCTHLPTQLCLGAQQLIFLIQQELFLVMWCQQKSWDIFPFKWVDFP
jgi:hypothetical protein